MSPADTALGDDAADAAGALDLMLADAALGTWRRFAPGMVAVRLAAGLSQRPDTVVRAAVGLAGELARVSTGRCELAAGANHRRFKNLAWTDNQALRVILQGYPARSASARSLLSDTIDALPWRDRQRLTFLLDNVVDASAPSNVPQLNPSVWKAFREASGRSVVSGLRNFVADMSTSPRVPTMVDRVLDQLEDRPPEDDRARGEAEVPAHLERLGPPTTPTVQRVPLLHTAPVIKKYHVIDLAPGSSMVEYLLSQGQQVFTISWRNPAARHRHCDFETYAAAILRALDATRSIARSRTHHLQSVRSGGTLSALLAGHRAATGRLGEHASFNLAVAVLDQRRTGLPSALLDEGTAKAAVLASAARGYLDGRPLAEVFAWLRPSDLIWNYGVNNYLRGRKPPAFDFLAGKADATMMAAALHQGFSELAVANSLLDRGSALGSPVELTLVDVESYVVAGISDHIWPWQSCYRSIQLLGGRARFVLSTSGRIASLVNPPGNPKASFLNNDANGPDSEKWLEGATPMQGSWWPGLVGWLAERGGGRERAPTSLGPTRGRLRPDGCRPGDLSLRRLRSRP